MADLADRSDGEVYRRVDQEHRAKKSLAIRLTSCPSIWREDHFAPGVGPRRQIPENLASQQTLWSPADVERVLVGKLGREREVAMKVLGVSNAGEGCPPFGKFDGS
jgi:hypothetical protein